MRHYQLSWPRGSTSSYWRAGLVCDDCAAYEHYVEEGSNGSSRTMRTMIAGGKSTQRQNFDNKRGDWKW